MNTSFLSGHQACGPLQFGMKGAQLQKASTQLRTSNGGMVTAATLRQGLVTNGVKYQDKALLTNRDHALRLEMRYTVGHPLSALTFQAREFHPATEYGKAIKRAWETLQDVADSKFPRTAAKGKYPAIAAITQTGKLTVSDTWEVDGIRIEVGILAGTFYGDPTMKYTAVLKATNLAAAMSAP